MIRFRAAAVVLLALASPASALDGRVIGLGGAASVFVWKSSKAQSEAMSLINAGVHQSNPAMLIPLLACIVPSGTRAIVTDGGIATQDIMIIEGESSGCRGNIPTEAWD